MAKKIIPKAFLTLWMLLLLSLGGYYAFAAPREAEYSGQENRNLAAFPAVFVPVLMMRLSTEFRQIGNWKREISSVLM